MPMASQLRLRPLWMQSDLKEPDVRGASSTFGAYCLTAEARFVDGGMACLSGYAHGVQEFFA